MADEPRIEELDKLIAKGKQKGFLTYDEVNDALPSDVVSLDQLDDIMLLFGSMDIELVDSSKSVRLPSEIEAQPEPVLAHGDADAEVEQEAWQPEPAGHPDRGHAGEHDRGAGERDDLQRDAGDLRTLQRQPGHRAMIPVRTGPGPDPGCDGPLPLMSTRRRWGRVTPDAASSDPGAVGARGPGRREHHPGAPEETRPRAE